MKPTTLLSKTRETSPDNRNTISLTILTITLIVFSGLLTPNVAQAHHPKGKKGELIIPPSLSEFPRSKGTIIKGGAFTLTDHHGKVVTDKNFRGKFLMIFFGYTFCPDVCPLDLKVMSEALKILDQEGIEVQPLFISFDPTRDTVERIAGYVTHFHPRLIGLTGSKDQTFAAAGHYGVDVSETYLADDPTSSYSLNHSSYTYLVGPDGTLLSMFRSGITPDKMAAYIRKAVKAKSKTH